MHTVAVETIRTQPTARRRPAVPFPAAKLLPPAPPAGLVDRPRLHELIERGTTGLVTVVSAHAGTGKTVLLSSWAAGAEPRRVAWLGLDRDDNWSPRFWLGVERALVGAGALDGPIATDGEGRLGAQSPTVSTVATSPSCSCSTTTTRSRARSSSGSCRPSSTARRAGSASCCRLAPTPAAPPAPPPDGDLTEIRAAELAFTVDECGEALAPFATDLAHTDVEAFRDRTEGWAAGIRFAALSLASEPDRERLFPPFCRRRSGGGGLLAERDSRPAARPPA